LNRAVEILLNSNGKNEYENILKGTNWFIFINAKRW
jgi:hypothetical protein